MLVYRLMVWRVRSCTPWYEELMMQAEDVSA